MSGMPTLPTDTLVHVVTGLRYVRSRMNQRTFFEVFDMNTDEDGGPATKYEEAQWKMFKDDLACWLMFVDRDRLRKLTAWINKEAAL